jgi:proline dehydrogenase
MIPPIADNFVAGEDAATAIGHVERLETDGIAGILNLLGEHYDDPEPADADTQAYVDLVRALDRRDTDCCVSVKPSQIGLDLGDDVFERNLARIVDAGDTFVWIDMEDHETVEVTLDAFADHAVATGGDVGVCVQANMRRTTADLERLADLPGKVRLVKGAYDPPADLAYRDKETVDERYREQLAYMFREFDGGVGVGSHDPAMVAHARDLHERYGTDFEVQMLMGVREEAQADLAVDGVPVFQYIPYGDRWLSYFYRRVRERKENALFALRAVLG